MLIYKFTKTAEMSAKNQNSTGIFYLIPNCFIRIIHLIPLMLLWNTLVDSGIETGMSLSQMLTYTFISNLLSDLLNIKSTLTHWVNDGPLLSLLQRPMSIYGSVFAESLGDTFPMLTFFTLPMLFISPLFRINIIPYSLWFFPSLILSVSLSFAVEFVFAALLVYMIRASWLVYSIKNAVTHLFSGTLIPFMLLPFGLGNLMKYLPFGSLGGAPLSIYAGIADPPINIVLIQLLWNLILWPVAISLFNKSRERLVVHGG